jgi:hypothetical protein
VANRDKRRRGRSRKSRPAGAAAGSGAKPSERRRARSLPAQTPRDAEGRPQAPWHPVPVSELLILVGAVGIVVSLWGGLSTRIPLLLAGVVAVLIGTIEVTLREHMSGFRSHALLLALLPTFVFHFAVIVIVVVVRGSAPGWLNIALLPFDALLFTTLFKLLRTRFQDVRREQLFSGRR